VGRGRGSAPRAPRGRETIRSHLTRLARQGGPLAARNARVGWKALVPNAMHERRALAEAVGCDRHAYRSARLVTRLKSRGPLAPLWGKRDAHIEGRTSRRTWGGRV
jgi:hypothetical protein